MQKYEKKPKPKKQVSPLLKACQCSTLFLFACAVLLGYLSQPRGQFLNTVHQNANESLSKLNNPKQLGSLGWTNEQVRHGYLSSSIVDKLLTKKWDAYVFVSFNYYIVEVTMVDLGYASQIIISLEGFKKPSQVISENMVSFSLADSFWDDSFTIDQKGLKFNLTRIQNPGYHSTHISFQAMSGNKTIIGNLTQHIPQENCMTFMRPYASVKCLSARSEGFVKTSWYHYDSNYRYSQTHTDMWMFSPEVGVSMFDGFRGSGYEWYWVWGMGIGWTENIEKGYPIKRPIRNVSLSLGVMYGMEEDFIMVDGTAIKLKGVHYSLNQTQTWQRLRFTSEQPKGQFEFNVTSRHHYYDNMIVIQKDMHKAYGCWNGTIQLQEGPLQFDKVFGLVEISKSRF